MQGLDSQFEKAIKGLGLPAARQEEMRVSFDESKKRQLVEMHASSSGGLGINSSRHTSQ